MWITKAMWHTNMPGDLRCLNLKQQQDMHTPVIDIAQPVMS